MPVSRTTKKPNSAAPSPAITGAAISAGSIGSPSLVTMSPAA